MARILIVDDDGITRTFLKHFLSRSGHETIEATHGSEARECYQKTSVDIVITDLLMPQEDGVDVLREVQKLHGKKPKQSETSMPAK